jgi:predicted P-loop ATPase/GTPase
MEAVVGLVPKMQESQVAMRIKKSIAAVLLINGICSFVISLALFSIYPNNGYANTIQFSDVKEFSILGKAIGQDYLKVAEVERDLNLTPRHITNDGICYSNLLGRAGLVWEPTSAIIGYLTAASLVEQDKDEKIILQTFDYFLDAYLESVPEIQADLKIMEAECKMINFRADVREFSSNLDQVVNKLKSIKSRIHNVQ